MGLSTDLDFVNLGSGFTCYFLQWQNTTEFWNWANLKTLRTISNTHLCCSWIILFPVNIRIWPIQALSTCWTHKTFCPHSVLFTFKIACATSVVYRKWLQIVRREDSFKSFKSYSDIPEALKTGFLRSLFVHKLFKLDSRIISSLRNFPYIFSS